MNNTLVYDGALECETGVGPAECAGERGGLYYQNASSTWNNVTTYQAAGASFDPLWNDTNSQGGDYFGTDVLSIAGNKFENYPLGIQVEKFHIDKWGIQALGMSSNSTILNALKQTSQIATRSFGYWYGLVGKQYADGELVIGGLNRAKATGPNLTLALNPSRNCPSGMVVNVNAITLNYNSNDPLKPVDPSNSADYNLLGTSASASLNYCIWPSYDVISMPSSVWNNFRDYVGGVQTGYAGTRSLGLNVYGMDYLANSVYGGDLSFTIQNALTIKIPNNQLVIPDIDLDQGGNVVEKNSSIAEVMINSLESTNGDDMAILGRTFLTSAYLYVDYESNTFTLWSSKNTTDSNISVIRSATNSSCTTSSSNGTTSTGSSGGSSANSNSTPASVSSPGKISGGAIAGIVIGVILLLLLLGLIAFILLRRRRSRARSRADLYPERPSGNGALRMPMGQAANPPQELLADEEAMTSKPELQGEGEWAHHPAGHSFYTDEMKGSPALSVNEGNPVEIEGSPYWATGKKP